MKNILVIAERVLDTDSPAFEKALSFAAGNKAKVHVLSVVYDTTFDQQELVSESELNDLKAKLMLSAEDSLKEMISGAPGVTGEVRWNKDLMTAVDEVLAGNSFDLIIKTGHRSEGFLYLPTDFQLLGLPAVPVLIISAQRWRSKPVIMATVDFSSNDSDQNDLNRRVLSHARECADLLGADLHCTYVITYNSALADLDIIKADKLEDRFREKRLPSLQKFAAEFGISADKIHVKTGKIEKVVPSIANRLKAELVVLGTNRRKGLKRALLGNSSEKILKILRTDILAVKPD